MRLVHCDRCRADVTAAAVRYTLRVTECDFSLGVETQKDSQATDLCASCARGAMDATRDPAITKPYPDGASPINYVWRDGDWRRYQ